ncbi:MAG: cytochrome b [Gammaproteobacteria bacterium]|nr:cytochrome b [Gammaproteobacteria bacterium]
MTWTNSGDGYGIPAIALHWIIAGMLLFLLPLGLWMTGLDYYHPWYNKGPDLHRSIGVLCGIALVLRGLVRIGGEVPRPLNVRGGLAVATSLAHAALYLVPVLLVISGYLISTADGRPVEVFGWFEVPSTLHGIEAQEDIAGSIHYWLAMLLIALIALHVAGALRHHFVFKDATLRRMLRPRTDHHQ